MNEQIKPSTMNLYIRTTPEPTPPKPPISHLSSLKHCLFEPQQDPQTQLEKEQEILRILLAYAFETEPPQQFSALSRSDPQLH